MHFTRVLNHLFNKLFFMFKIFCCKLRSFCSITKLHHYEKSFHVHRRSRCCLPSCIFSFLFFPLRNLSFVRQLPNNIKSKSLKIHIIYCSKPIYYVSENVLFPFNSRRTHKWFISAPINNFDVELNYRIMIIIRCFSNKRKTN